ncbi:hypothetical protein MUP38_07940 [Candidatus Bathyarchaeota archaeon]|nr:hypothetical protein [Candidatus Bathyarchaeota archaeon]
MSSRARKTRKSLRKEDAHSSLEMKVNEERLGEMLETASLKDVPLEERRKEAQKPLYLVRYE